ncbi:MAG: hypothetical protein A3C50_03960 [Candidatus Staskawiczbacteria bacterium RIFCSPHIGHO2_02_FULL_43_16]|uniref:Uncharacterized protein n=1 Tax=Candidatus Staskawiczbacteria bacterium RIFCSPHIGHO2_01_FULL_41_41 TaxID=1802203 RepID=A0A1G2HRT1_9BACT|nr:MAG: hypothetical protein A2822_03845 [Candidatus Staskawiczbacteria bacterium RIFCSPHIGHO2_01_FULL_41_41]OGZ68087.1 MAG: hypothetical protein A3C50_03960 [Candidatus Staskawiczbacteria bacterium RIFCSPHIGHO2_02_FULL_43_16]OGZ74825.1 MAG: hypothetical protein A3A12_03150 [Candidatus Staskawiczbacteria bacterium RIFCSPLOWO2_01_FULL_43_17b]
MPPFNSNILPEPMDESSHLAPKENPYPNPYTGESGARKQTLLSQLLRGPKLPDKKEPAKESEPTFWKGGKASPKDVKKVIEKWDPNIRMKESERKALAHEVVGGHLAVKQKNVVKLEKKVATEKSKDPDVNVRIKEREQRHEEIKALKKLINKE